MSTKGFVRVSGGGRVGEGPPVAGGVTKQLKKGSAGRSAVLIKPLDVIL